VGSNDWLKTSIQKVNMRDELLILQLRNAIADKEWVIACANMETARGGWTCDWHEGIQKADASVQYAIEQIHKYG